MQEPYISRTMDLEFHDIQHFYNLPYAEPPYVPYLKFDDA